MGFVWFQIYNASKELPSRVTELQESLEEMCPQALISKMT